jgi:hypothetical protein
MRSGGVGKQQGMGALKKDDETPSLFGGETIMAGLNKAQEEIATKDPSNIPDVAGSSNSTIPDRPPTIEAKTLNPRPAFEKQDINRHENLAVKQGWSTELLKQGLPLEAVDRILNLPARRRK